MDHSDLSTTTLIHALADICSADPARQSRTGRQMTSDAVFSEALLALADTHHVFPLLYRTVRTNTDCRPALTELQHAQLRQTCRNIALQNLRIQTELLRVVAALETAGIGYLMYKGPILAKYAYGDSNLRMYNDFDLIISGNDLPRVEALMGAEGYRSIVPVNAVQRQKLRYFGKEITYIRPEPGQRRFEADIHWMLLRPAFRVPLAFSDFERHAVSLPVGDRLCTTLDPTYTFLSTCIHNGGNDGWTKLKHVADLDAILRTWGDHIDWDEVWRVGKKYDIDLLIASALLLSAKFFDTPVPADPERHAPGAGNIADIYARFDQPENVSWIVALRRHLRIRRKIWTRIIVSLYRTLDALSPNFADQEFLPLPFAGWIYPLYFLIRPLRILISGRNKGRYDVVVE